MSATNSMRIDGDLFAAAKSIGALTNRSAAQQLSHWARIGLEVETSPTSDPDAIQRVLTRETGASYDSLSEHDQAIVRAAWDQRATERRKALNFVDEFTHDGSGWSDADADGIVTVHRGAAAGPLDEDHR